GLMATGAEPAPCPLAGNTNGAPISSTRATTSNDGELMRNTSGKDVRRIRRNSRRRDWLDLDQPASFPGPLVIDGIVQIPLRLLPSSNRTRTVSKAKSVDVFASDGGWLTAPKSFRQLSAALRTSGSFTGSRALAPAADRPSTYSMPRRRESAPSTLFHRSCRSRGNRWRAGCCLRGWRIG